MSTLTLEAPPQRNALLIYGARLIFVLSRRGSNRWLLAMSLWIIDFAVSVNSSLNMRQNAENDVMAAPDANLDDYQHSRSDTNSSHSQFGTTRRKRNYTTEVYESFARD